MEYGFGYIIIRSPYTPYSIYLRGTIGVFHWILHCFPAALASSQLDLSYSLNALKGIIKEDCVGEEHRDF